MTMRTSAAGRERIKAHEGLSLTAYLCPAGVWTIGYGSTAGVREGMGITREQADARLIVDLREAEAAVNAHVKVPLNQAQFDALVSFVFNAGVGAFRSSTLLRVLNAGHYDRVDDELLRWTKATVGGRKVVLAGLVRRRADEAATWNSVMAPPVVMPEYPDHNEAGVIAEAPQPKPITQDAELQAAGGLSVGGVLSVAATRASESDTALWVFLGLCAVAVVFILWRRRRA